jgi:hypothetical protein
MCLVGIFEAVNISYRNRAVYSLFFLFLFPMININTLITCWVRRNCSLSGQLSLGNASPSCSCLTFLRFWPCSPVNILTGTYQVRVTLLTCVARIQILREQRNRWPSLVTKVNFYPGYCARVPFVYASCHAAWRKWKILFEKTTWMAVVEASTR